MAQAQLAQIPGAGDPFARQVAGLQEKGKETLEKGKQSATELGKRQTSASEAISRGKESVSQALKPQQR